MDHEPPDFASDVDFAFFEDELRDEEGAARRRLPRADAFFVVVFAGSESSLSDSELMQ